MIKANELRQGNLFQYNGKAEKVHHTFEEGIVFDYFYKPVEVSGRGWYLQGGTMEGKRENLFAPWGLAEPIPLTEEWLERMGFEKGPIRRKGHVDLEWGDFSKCWQFRVGEWLIDLQYVHQLQNLYFALCGEELTIKP